jgi:ArsR family transcriptional regulator, virulence genes transcriptional regulator
MIVSDIKLAEETTIFPLKNKKALYLLRAINHPLRMSIIQLIDANKKLKVTEIYETLRLQQAIVSQHLSILRKAGFVVIHKEKKYVYYSIQYSFLQQFSKGVDLILQ